MLVFEVLELFGVFEVFGVLGVLEVFEALVIGVNVVSFPSRLADAVCCGSVRGRRGILYRGR